jgi:multiple antibiotic resistance protein
MLLPIIHSFSKFFFLLAPFFVLTVFLSMTDDDRAARRSVALRVTFAVLVTCYLILFFGNTLFSLFGITLNSFRVGAGVLLFLSSIDLVRGKPIASRDMPDAEVAVVPLAIPVTVGPATTGAIMVMGAESKTIEKLAAGCIGLTLAVLVVGTILFLGSEIKAVLKTRGILIMSKITGVALSALAAQMVMLGIRGFFVG